MTRHSWHSISGLWERKTAVIATLSIVAILASQLLRFGFHAEPRIYHLPLLATLVIGGLPLVFDLLRKLLKRALGSDLLGGMSVLTSIWLGEYLAGAIIVLTLSGGEALEHYPYACDVGCRTFRVGVQWRSHSFPRGTVIATPCPLLIAIRIAMTGVSISSLRCKDAQ